MRTRFVFISKLRDKQQLMKRLVYVEGDAVQANRWESISVSQRGLEGSSRSLPAGAARVCKGLGEERREGNEPQQVTAGCQGLPVAVDVCRARDGLSDAGEAACPSAPNSGLLCLGLSP